MCIYLTIIKIKDGRMAHFPTELKQCRKFPQRGDMKKEFQLNVFMCFGGMLSQMTV